MKQKVRQNPAGIGVVFSAMILTTVALAQTGQISQVENPGVQRRMATMIRANDALTLLSDMMGARAMFDRNRAKTARQTLMMATRDIPTVFREPHSDLLSHAKPLIWSQWKDFTARAQTARRAAKTLNTGSLSRLRQSLPHLVLACLNCHDTYRHPMQ